MSQSLRVTRCAALWEVFGTEDSADPSEVGVLFFFGIFGALNSATIDTVMRAVSVDIDRNLISYYASLYVSRGEPTLAADDC